MKLPQNIRAFMQGLPFKKMRGDDLFVAVAYFLAKGDLDAQISVREIERNWSKTIFGKSYNSGFAHRAQGRVDPAGSGHIRLTEEGVAYVEVLLGSHPSIGTSLLIFKKANSHSFDKKLRAILRGAKTCVDIADTYVSGALFDVLLDEIPQSVPIRFLYGTDTGGFSSRAARFAKQYNFLTKQSRGFHDRFLIVDGSGYLSGPSLKDAADNKPATLVVVSKSESKELQTLFDELW